MKKISMIVPCFNEEGNVSLFYEDVKKTYKNNKKYEIELIFINDGSSDNTLKELKKLSKNKDFAIKVLSFSRNFGKESVIYAGLKAASGDYTVLIDADMQQPPSLTPKMAEILDNNPDCDCVCYYQESRIEGKVISFAKKMFYKIINKMTDVEMKQGASDFRMFRTSVREALISVGERCRFTKGIFAWVGFDTEYIPYIPEERASGESKWSPKKLFKYAMDGIVSFSTKPLKLSIFIGFLVSLAALIYLIVVIIQKLTVGISIPGYPTIVVLVLFIGGIQLLCIGIVGEYISKIYLESKQRPVYVIKEEITNEK